MTRQEFISRQNAMTHGLTKRSIIWIVLFFGGLIGCAFVSSYLDEHSESYQWASKALGIGLLVFLVTTMVLLVVFNHKWQKQFGYRCPKCNKRLFGFLAQLAIASGNCGYCGKPVFSHD
jgi:hypothetical protein